MEHQLDKLRRYQRSVVPVLLLSSLLLCLDAQAEEPSNGEVCAALGDVIEAKNEQMAEAKKRCESGNFENDPLAAMQCLALGAGTHYEVTRCEKVACEKAANQPGYICDFVLGLKDTSGDSVLPSSMQGAMASGDLGQGRFVQTGNRWLFVPLRQ